MTIEAIQKARMCIGQAETTVMSHDQSVPCMRLEVLAAAIEWKQRYIGDLGKIKYFMLNNPLCLQKFELIRDERNTTTESYIITERVNVEKEAPPRPDDVDDDWDEYSIMGSEVEEDIVQTSRRAIEVLKSILLAQVSSNPIHSMGLTVLNSVSKWSRNFSNLKSMKKWINITLPSLGLSCGLIVVDRLQPGNDVVRWCEPIDTDNGARAGIGAHTTVGVYANTVAGNVGAGNLPLRGVASVPAQALAADVSAARFTPAPRLLSHQHATVANNTVDAGVLVRDFFHIPTVKNSTEASYLKSTKRTTDMFAYFVQSGALKASLRYGEGQFEDLEWRGDAVLHLEITNIQFLSQASLYDVGGLSARRSNAEQRLTLALLFDDFQLAQFMRVCPDSWTRDLWKVKGDIVEAMIGEFYTRLNDCTEEGLPFGHADRRAAFDLIKRIAQAALERGSMLISIEEQRALSAAALAPGGGGYLLTTQDRAATIRCSGR